MRIVLWDTRKVDVAKDFAGGFGVGMFTGHGGLGGRIVRRFFTRDHRPTALVYAYLASILRALGHQVEYAVDRVPAGADLYIFHPALMTVPQERHAMREALTASPGCRVWVVGAVANFLPEAFAGLEVMRLRGEAEQLFWKFDEAWSQRGDSFDLGKVQDLDLLPFPDWSLFQPRKFRIAFDFTRFPTGLIQQSRGCTFKCNYCPYIALENATRLRSPESVAAEMRAGMRQFGFRSFKFRDPLFGTDRKRVFRLVELIGQLPRKIQFSIESRIDVLRPDVLRALHGVGLTSVTVGIETPDNDTLRRYRRAPVRDDRQRDFIAQCRALGVRTVAGFMVGFPDDTAESIHDVLRYAKSLNPTFANFNIVTPYPGTEFFEQMRPQIASFSPADYSVYKPVLKYRHLTSQQVSDLHAKCFVSYYFRSRWLLANARLMWPTLGKLIPPPAMPLAPQGATHEGPPKPHGNFSTASRLPVLPSSEDA